MSTCWTLFNESVNAPLTLGSILLILPGINTKIFHSCFSFTVWCSFNYAVMLSTVIVEKISFSFISIIFVYLFKPLYLSHFLVYHWWSLNKLWYWLRSWGCISHKEGNSLQNYGLSILVLLLYLTQKFLYM